ncbi:MAG: hypothetical protein LBI28_10635 [Treponema sp.]|jgi:hypothetical protein|nr:hypothetical protein [Treponema sp.]
MKNTKWNNNEYDIVISAYCELWIKQKNGKSIDVAQATRDCSIALNGSRSPGSVRMRFGNIAYVFSLHNLEIVENVQALQNITIECSEYIWEEIKRNIYKNEEGENGDAKVADTTAEKRTV